MSRSWEAWRSRRWMKACAQVGSRLRLIGRPTVHAAGKISIGHRFYLCSRPVESHLVAGEGAVLNIGDDVSVGFGAAISAYQHVSIGQGTILGPYCIVMDTSFHRGAGDQSVHHDCRPVVIGADCRIGSSVIITKGTRIGDGAQILAGSVVSSDIPPGACAGGGRARVLGMAGDPSCRWGGPVSLLPDILMEVCDLAAPPELDETPVHPCLRGSARSHSLCEAIVRQTGVRVLASEISVASTYLDVARIVRLADFAGASTSRMSEGFRSKTQDSWTQFAF